MARLDFNGQIPGQLELPDEIVRQFRLPCRWERGDGWQIEPGHTVIILPTHLADGRRAPKSPKVHWHDWMRERTTPWRRAADRPLSTLLAKLPGVDGVTHELVTEAA